MQPARRSAAALQLPTAAYSCNPYGESLVQPARTCGVALQLQSPAESVQCCCECSRRLTGAGAQSAATGTASVWENQRRVAVLGIGVQTHHAAPGPFEFDWNVFFCSSWDHDGIVGSVAGGSFGPGSLGIVPGLPRSPPPERQSTHNGIAS